MFAGAAVSDLMTWTLFKLKGLLKLLLFPELLLFPGLLELSFSKISVFKLSVKSSLYKPFPTVIGCIFADSWLSAARFFITTAIGTIFWNDWQLY